MYQTVLTNNHYTLKDVCLKYDKLLSSIGDKVESNQNYGTKNTIDKLLFIKIKRLKPLLATFENPINKCCLVIQNKQDLLNKLYEVIN